VCPNWFLNVTFKTVVVVGAGGDDDDDIHQNRTALIWVVTQRVVAISY